MMQVGSNSKPTTPISNLDSAEHTLPTTGRSAPLGASLEHVFDVPFDHRMNPKARDGLATPVQEHGTGRRTARSQ